MPDAGLRIGAWANPPGSTGSSSQKIALLESQIGRKFDLSLHYDPWTASFPSPDELEDRSEGRTPEVSWGCGTTDAAVAAGHSDALIAARARAMAAFGGPILLRYKWEFNLIDTANDRQSCYDSAVDQNGFFNPTDFIAAWRHIHDVFVAAGATNVSFFWCPSGGGTSAVPYWPGDAYVDVVGFDAYDANGVGLANTIARSYALYAHVGTQIHPVVVGETGAISDQATFLDGSTRAELANQFPLITGVTYFDADSERGAWHLTSEGLASFITFAKP